MSTYGCLPITIYTITIYIILIIRKTDDNMTNRKIVLPSLRCNRCGHEWIPRRPKEPDVCPKCSSRYWNKKRRRK